MKGIYKHLGLLAAMSLMGENVGTPFAKEKRKEIDFSKKEPPIPKGCDKYFFMEDGHWNTYTEYNGYHIKRTEIVYSCIATSSKKAIAKFNKNYKP